MSTSNIRVRFAPSPTGYLHIGGVRTALYNYLFAKHNSGKFILRIEDTDQARSDSEYTEVILRGMKWIGLDWDEGPYFQSERKELYKKALDQLLASGKVYRCFCTAEDLKEKRDQGIMGYDGTCRDLTQEEIAQKEAAGLKAVYRLRCPDSGTIAFEDVIKGRIEIDASTIKDFVVVKSDGMPTYNFACAVDDADLHISHIIRGDDHISNTPKQILVYEMLDVEVPLFAHLPQVHGSDGKKLSKRTGAVSLEEYKDKGYLPEALRNYLALLGWSTSDSQQLFGQQELIDKFDLTRCTSSSGIFDLEKLDWINGKYIRDLKPEELARLSFDWLKEAGLADDVDNIPQKVIDAIALEQEKIAHLSEIPGRIDILVKDEIEYDEKSVRKRLLKEGVKEILQDTVDIFEGLGTYDKTSLENSFREYCEKREIGAGKLFHPVRVAVSGRMQGPGVFELLEFVGKEKAVERMKYVLSDIVKE